MICAQVLIVAWLLTLLGRSRPVAILIALLALIPLHEGVSLAMALHGLWGDPSITTLLLLLLVMARQKLALLRDDWRMPALIAALAATLYASALGPWNFDLYRFGYQPACLVALLGTGALALCWRGYPLWLWLLSIDLIAWRAGWLESSNLWDYCVDPLLIFVMLALALRNGYRASQNPKLPRPRS